MTRFLSDILLPFPNSNDLNSHIQATQVFSYEIYKIFKKNFFYRTSLTWWLLLAVNSVNQLKHTLKVYAVEKEMVYLAGTSKVSVFRYIVFI